VNLDDLREYAAQLVAWPIEEATCKCEQAVRSMIRASMLIIGCGNRERSDDGAERLSGSSARDQSRIWQVLGMVTHGRGVVRTRGRPY
jgi:hypothetical protein